MNKIVASLVTKKAADTARQAAEDITVFAEEQVVKTRKVYALELAVAVLGGLVLGMFLSPRKTVTYKIASNNNINSCDEDEEDENYDEDEDFTEEDSKSRGKFIKL
ncbi:MAG: hypothetical protein J6N15_04965 [Ruminiclostridium sp.]|nr:hypothetical protein [Ruminiclostridium sp.]